MVDGEIVIAPRGRLVYGGLTLADVSQAMEQAVRYWPSVVLDLERIEAIDAAGLGWIAGSYRSASEKGVSFRLRNPTRRIQEVLRITKLAQIIPGSCDADGECLVACEPGAGWRRSISSKVPLVLERQERIRAARASLRDNIPRV